VGLEEGPCCHDRTFARGISLLFERGVLWVVEVVVVVVVVVAARRGLLLSMRWLVGLFLPLLLWAVGLFLSPFTMVPLGEEGPDEGVPEEDGVEPESCVVVAVV